MYRQIITPKNTKFTLQLPAEFVGKTVEIIAFTLLDTSNQSADTRKKTHQEAIAFFKKNAIDFNKIEKWSREDLYE